MRSFELPDGLVTLLMSEVGQKTAIADKINATYNITIS